MVFLERMLSFLSLKNPYKDKYFEYFTQSICLQFHLLQSSKRVKRTFTAPKFS